MVANGLLKQKTFFLEMMDHARINDGFKLTEWHCYVKTC